MPKRTNEFQRLMAYIYSQLAPQGATVTEFALLNERHGSARREVDVLLEQVVAGTCIRLAVECRDRSDTDDVEWIDGLIGKYHDLDVSKVVAVSNSGFSQAAREKAQAHNIDTRSLQQANMTDWPAELAKLRVTALSPCPLVLIRVGNQLLHIERLDVLGNDKPSVRWLEVGNVGEVYTFAPSGESLATISGCEIEIWDVEGGERLGALSFDGRDVTSLAFTPDGRTLASGSEDGTIRLWGPA